MLRSNSSMRLTICGAISASMPANFSWLTASIRPHGRLPRNFWKYRNSLSGNLSFLKYG